MDQPAATDAPIEAARAAFQRVPVRGGATAVAELLARAHVAREGRGWAPGASWTPAGFPALAIGVAPRTVDRADPGSAAF